MHWNSSGEGSFRCKKSRQGIQRQLLLQEGKVEVPVETVEEVRRRLNPGTVKRVLFDVLEEAGPEGLNISNLVDAVQVGLMTCATNVAKLQHFLEMIFMSYFVANSLITTPLSPAEVLLNKHPMNAPAYPQCIRAHDGRAAACAVTVLPCCRLPE